MGVQPDVAHQRDDRVEDLRDAAAERGRVDVENALSLQGLCQSTDLLDRVLAHDVRVVGQRALAQGDLLKHRGSVGV